MPMSRSGLDFLLNLRISLDSILILNFSVDLFLLILLFSLIFFDCLRSLKKIDIVETLSMLALGSVCCGEHSTTWASHFARDLDEIGIIKLILLSEWAVCDMLSCEYGTARATHLVR